MVGRALLVGINCYPGLGDLEGPENDVAAIEGWLQTAPAGCLDPSKDITKITTSSSNPNGHPKTYVQARPVMSQIYDWVDELVLEGSAQNVDFPLGDRLYLFFAGHGHHTPGNTAVFMANAWVNNLGEVIPMQALAEYMRGYALFKEVILIADACREQIDFAPDAKFTRKAVISQNVGLVRKFDAYPCPVGVKTKELLFNGKRGGVLTNAFLTGVKGFAARGGIVRSDFLKSYMINAVEQMLGSTPEINCSEQATAFQVATAADRTTHLTVKQAVGTVGGQTDLIDGLTNTTIAQQDLAKADLEKDLTPGFYFLKRNGMAEKSIRVAWETTDVEY